MVLDPRRKCAIRWKCIASVWEGPEGSATGVVAVGRKRLRCFRSGLQGRGPQESISPLLAQCTAHSSECDQTRAGEAHVLWCCPLAAFGSPPPDLARWVMRDTWPSCPCHFSQLRDVKSGPALSQPNCTSVSPAEVSLTQPQPELPRRIMI